MPLDLGRWECLWEEGGDDGGQFTHCDKGCSDVVLSWLVALNPNPHDLPPLDPKDKFLLGDPSSATGGSYTNGATGTAGAPSTPLPAHVPWLRKTEYISREGVQRGSGIQEPYVPPIINFFCSAMTY
jgi:RNA polymerase II-associated factor 1